jgi:hypothetical protein
VNNSEEICSECARVIRIEERAMVWKERVVCAMCHGRLSIGSFEQKLPAAPAGLERGYRFTDHGLTLPPKPVPGFFSVMKFKAYKRIRITAKLVGGSTVMTDTIELTDDWGEKGIVQILRDRGLEPVEIEILERFWSEELGTVAKVGLLALFVQ